MTKTKKSILIVEDHPVVREGLKTIIKSKRNSGYYIIGEADSASEAFEMLQRLTPDIVVADVSLSGPTNGIKLTERICKVYPTMKVLVLTMHAKIDYVCESLKAGAAGYLTKDSAASELFNALNTISAGNVYLDSSISPDLIQTLSDLTGNGEHLGDSSYAMLTKREQEVFRLYATGKKTSDISSVLDLSPKTIETHKTRILKKLHIENLFELYAYAIRIGIVDADFF